MDATIKLMPNMIAIDHLLVYQMNSPPAKWRRKIVQYIARLSNELTALRILKSM